MHIDDVKRQAFAMPLTSPAFPRGPYRFKNREFLIVTYRADLDALPAVVPELLPKKADPRHPCQRDLSRLRTHAAGRTTNT
jgi:acetoacetate decarboxylase